MSAPLIIGLLAVASVAMWLRGKSWASIVKGPPSYAATGALAGLAALLIALVAATPLVEAITDRAVQWSMYPVARGSSAQAILVAILVGVTALATELVLRGWLVETALDLRAHPALGIGIGALAEAVLADGNPAARIGAAAFGAGLGWMYVAAGRSVVAPVCARLVFVLGAVALEATQLIG